MSDSTAPQSDSGRHTLSASLSSAITGSSTTITKGKRIARRSVYSSDTTRLTETNGYLYKKSKKGSWQRRWFEVNNAYLIYKQSQSSKKLDAVIDLRNCTDVATTNRFGDFALTLLSVGEEDANPDAGTDISTYHLRGRDNKEATAWVSHLKERVAYYARLRSAGQSEVAELYQEEDRRSMLGGGAAVMGQDLHRLISSSQITKRFATDFSMKADAEDGEVLFEGWLGKKSPSKWVSYQERYCLLSKGIFSYYKSPKADQAQGAISMSSVEYARLFSDDDDCLQFELKMDNGRTFLFKAETHTICASWVEALTNAKHTDAMVQEELENVRIRAISPPSIVAFDKLSKNDQVREQQVNLDLDDLFGGNVRRDDAGPERSIASCMHAVDFLSNMLADCRADAKIGKPSRPDVLQHFFSPYVERIEAEILPLLTERDKAGVVTTSEVDVEQSFRRAELLSQKFLAGTRKARQASRSASMSKQIEKKDVLSGLDKWLFGEEPKPQTKPPQQQGQLNHQSQEEVEEDEEPPVIFTLNMSDLRSLIHFMYTYQDLFTQIQLEYADSRFEANRATLHRSNSLWSFLPVVIDAFVDGEDGARRGMQTAATGAVSEQILLGASAVDRVNSSLYFTHTPSDLWECLNAHSHIAGTGENNSERLQLKIVAAIAGVCAATVKQITEDCLDPAKEYNFEYVCAVVNDCSQHVESLDALLEQINSEPVKARLEPLFEKITLQIYDAAQRCCDVLISIVFDDLKEQIGKLFTKDHDVSTIVATIHDYTADFREGLQPFYFVKLAAKLLTSTVSVYLRGLTKQLNAKGGAAVVKNGINAGIFEDDAVAFRECFEQYVGGAGLDQPLKVIDDCVRFICCDPSEIADICESLVQGRGEVYASSLFQGIRTVTLLRPDSYGNDGHKDRKGMLSEVAGLVGEIVARESRASSVTLEEELGRDGEILTSAFPNKETSLFKMLSDVVHHSSGKSEKEKEKERREKELDNRSGGGGGDLDEIELEDDFNDDDIKHFNSAAVESNTDKSAKVGARRRFTQMLKKGEEVGDEGELGGHLGDIAHLSGWLEKQSPSGVKAWQQRWFTLNLDGHNKHGGTFSWHKKEDAPAQRSINFEAISAPPTIKTTNRIIVKNKKNGKVKLRNVNEDNLRVWKDIEGCRTGPSEAFTFIVEFTEEEDGKTRELHLRAAAVDDMLKWVNGLTVVWQKFQGVEVEEEQEGGEEEEEEENTEELDFKAAIPVSAAAGDVAGDGGGSVSVPTWIPQMEEDVKKPVVVEVDEIDAILNMTLDDIGEAIPETAEVVAPAAPAPAPAAPAVVVKEAGEIRRQSILDRQQQQQQQQRDDGGDEDGFNLKLEKGGSSLIARNSEMSTGEKKQAPAECCIVL
jgi:hypothetical protein